MNGVYTICAFGTRAEVIMMRKKMLEVDMINGSIFKSVVAFVIPLILGNVLQLLYNAADIIVVSRFAGSEAMAAVGATGSLTSLIVSLFIGLSVGTSVVVSKNYGAHNSLGVHRGVHSSMLLSIVAGAFALVIGLLFSKRLLILMGTPEGTVLDGAVLYMNVYFIAVPGTLIYNFGAAILRAVGDTKRPLYILTFSGIVNVLLNLLFVIVFHMDVAGVAIATAVSTYISAIAVLITLIRSETVYKLSLRHLKFYKNELLEVIRVGVPAGLQSSVFAISNVLIQSAINSFGTVAIAGSAAASNIEGFVYTAMNAFSHAAITAVSQNYGAKNEKRIYRSYYVSTACVAVVGVVLGLVAAIFGRQLLGIYITDSPEAIEMGMIKIIYLGLPYFMCGILEVQTGMIRGFGYSTVTMLCSFFGACAFRILWIMFILPLNHTLQVLYLCWPVSWIVVMAMQGIFFLCVRKKAIKRMYEA